MLPNIVTTWFRTCFRWFEAKHFADEKLDPRLFEAASMVSRVFSELVAMVSKSANTHHV